MNLKELKNKLKQLNQRPNKKLGQNFLINEEIALEIVNAVKATSYPLVEIGPGLGALTHFFDSQNLTLIEKDKKMALYWKEKGFLVFCEDALKFDWTQLPSPFVLFGNLPYQIAGALVLEMSILKSPPKQMILMMQKEVAQRVLARTHTKDYGILSVMSQMFWDVTPLIHVSKIHFYPSPKVDGSVLVFQLKDAFSDLEATSYLQFIKSCFAQRRKKLINKLPHLSTKEWEIFFKNHNLSLNARAEELPPEVYIKIYKEFQNS